MSAAVLPEPSRLRTIQPTAGSGERSGINLPLCVHNEARLLLAECDAVEADLVAKLEKVRADRIDYLAMQVIADRQLARWDV